MGMAKNMNLYALGLNKTVFKALKPLTLYYILWDCGSYQIAVDSLIIETVF